MSFEKVESTPGKAPPNGGLRIQCLLWLCSSSQYKPARSEALLILSWLVFLNSNWLRNKDDELPQSLKFFHVNLPRIWFIQKMLKRISGHWHGIMLLYLSITSFVSGWLFKIGILNVTDLLLGVTLKMCYASPAKAKLRIGIMFSCSVLLLKEFGRFGGLYEVVTCEMVVYNFLLKWDWWRLVGY